MDSSLENVLKKTPQFTRMKRHLHTLVQHSTPKKLSNLIRVELERKSGALSVKGFPYIIIIDPINFCNLKCPLCPTGLREKEISRERISLPAFKSFVDQFKAYAYEVILHNWGEPFMNKEILSMIRYCSDQNIGTNLSSNMNVMPFSGEDVVKSGLEYLIISLDGTDQETYQVYRKGGDIQKVLFNLKAVTSAKKKLKSRTPVIEWQFIVMKHNQHQVDAAKKFSRELDIDLLRFIPVGLPFDARNKKELAREWYPDITLKNGKSYVEDRFLQKKLQGGCFYLYRSATVTAAGKLAPCCVVWKDGDEFGDMTAENFCDIWNNDFYKSARSLFSKQQKPDNAKTTCCERCPIFEKTVNNPFS